MKTITELRQERGWSKAELGRRLDKVSPQAVLYWESGVNVPSGAHWRRMAELFGVPMDQIRIPKLNGKDDHADD